MLANNNFAKNSDEFLLYIAAPTQWSAEEKEEYRQFVQQATEKRVEWVISESDAAYYNKSTADDWVLVVDYGSSTIDFTLMHGKKTENDISQLSCPMGARTIERELYAAYVKTEEYSKSKTRLDDELQNNGKDPIDPIDFLRLYWREGKERMYTDKDDTVELSSDAKHILKQFAGIKLKNINDFFVGSYEDPENKIYAQYIKDVKELFKKVHDKVAEKLSAEEMKNLKVILSGGASRMGWVEQALNELFGDGTVQVDAEKKGMVDRDNDPEYVVSEGIVKYAKLLHDVEQEMNKVLNAVMDKISELQDGVEQKAREVCRDYVVNMFDNYPAIKDYCSTDFQDGLIADDDPRNGYGTYYKSSVEYLVKDILPDFISQVQADVNKGDAKRQIKEELESQLVATIKSILLEAFKTLALELDDSVQDLVVSLNDMPDMQSLVIPNTDVLCNAILGDRVCNSYFGINILEIEGSYRKSRDCDFRIGSKNKCKDPICKEYASFKPYNETGLVIIRQKIYLAAVQAVVDAVQKRLMFEPCGYDMKSKLQNLAC